MGKKLIFLFLCTFVLSFQAEVNATPMFDFIMDGNTFSDSHSTGKKLLVGDFVVGASLIYRKFKLSYAQVLRTKEFDRQRSGQNFGSISLSYTY